MTENLEQMDRVFCIGSPRIELRIYDKSVYHKLTTCISNKIKKYI